jgi:hypothetical protein
MERMAVFIIRENENFDMLDDKKKTEAVRELFKKPELLR